MRIEQVYRHPADVQTAVLRILRETKGSLPVHQPAEKIFHQAYQVIDLIER